MALVIEDGTGRADAESYVSVAEADAYHSARLNTLWAIMSTAEKEASLRRGTDYLVQTYRDSWEGSRLTLAQALDWPRLDVPVRDAVGGYGRFASFYASDAVPLAVRQAAAQMAFKAAMGELAEDVGPAVKSEKVGPIEVVYQDGAQPVIRYRSIDMMLAPFLKSGGSSTYVRIRRA